MTVEEDDLDQEAAPQEDDDDHHHNDNVTATAIAVPVSHDSETTTTAIETTAPPLDEEEDIAVNDGLLVVEESTTMPRTSFTNGDYTPIGEGGRIASPGAGSSSSSFRCYASCCWTFLKFLSHFAVAILTVVTIFLFLQVQYLTVMVQQEQTQINQLSVKLANQTQGQIQELTNKVNQEHSLTLYQMAGTFALLACLLTSFHMYSHLRQYNEPLVQRKIVTILWMSPIYAVTSFFSLVFPVADGYLAVIKDFYEAYAIFTFLSFLIAVLGRGDRQVAIQTLSRHADHLKQPTKCLRTCYHPPPEQSDWAKANAVVTECQILAMQFVFIRPITSILGFVCTTFYEANDYYGDTTYDDAASSSYAYFKSPAFYISMITNISVFLAFAGLLKFYHAVREDLAWCQPFSKFMTIKGIVFLTFWQGLLISIVVSSLNRNNTSHSSQFVHSGTASTNAQGGHATSNNEASSMEEANAIQNFLICLEMLFFSIAHYCVFPVEEWQPNYRPQTMAKPGIGIKDFVSDMSYIISTSRQRRKHYKSRSGSGGAHSQIPSFDSEFDDADADADLDYVDVEENGGGGYHTAHHDDVLDPELHSNRPHLEESPEPASSRRRSTLQELCPEDRRDPVSYQQQGHHELQ